ncbi:YbhB/YbcL family Raf kinase inhibitor-like protein [Candidatus Cryosericum terrychapinii]|uniref:YbhB/YbcL family Raf kinase inhibitor-like protein n=1 Tax=Candidatus Cryosericum terrychapinii TaxID=2290919 RepID=A0A398D558_9BACT|nr:YbhB/YbcL family Raf kinase inhibitor-like protein [Candidatus Cryosericum terrychapinii]RIE06601.1 YbhB/YbcL family Raf kinase inhibitor-like protein [Candidatus Cryosericum terrychapinii]
MGITVTSTAFTPGKPIPIKYTGQGENISPDLSWKDAPDGVVSFALVCDDPDAPAGTWVHWIIWNIPATSTGLAQGVPANTSLSDGSVQGTTSAGTSGYHGPMPPRGNAHRYYFRVYTLDTMLSLPASANRPQLDAAMRGHVLSQGQLMGTYQRQ